MPKRIAITIAGAVSLGSYEAGVLYELLRAIRTNNDAAASEDGKIYIDVLTGASAGGMTAAMVSQRLMYDAASLQSEFTNVLYQAWVERISLLGLVKMRWKEKKWHSLFSSDLIDSIGRDMLISSLQQLGSGPHPAVEQINGVPETVRVGLALANLNGIDYMIPILGSDEGGFNYTTSLDHKTFEVTPAGRSDVTMWNLVCAAAVIRQSRETGEREMILARWGLVPFFTKDLKDVKGLSTINARSETITKAPTWREPFKKRRCLIPASFFYEWPKEGKPPKQPYAFELGSSSLFAFAGLWDAWKDKDGHWLQSYAIVTTEANELMTKIHPRMPVILHPRDCDRWLDREVTEQLPIDLLRPFESEEMEVYEANPKVGNVRNNGPEMMRAAAKAAEAGELPL